MAFETESTLSITTINFLPFLLFFSLMANSFIFPILFKRFASASSVIFLIGNEKYLIDQEKLESWRILNPSGVTGSEIR